MYLGWQSRGNFGDDLLLETWRAALDDPLDVLAPLYLRDLPRTGLRYLRDRARMTGSERAILLGGGTAIGFRGWADHVSTAKRMYATDSVVIAGAGAATATDEYALGLQEQDWPAWQGLASTTLLGVRGPLTAAECAAHWRPTTVIGDPALLYPQLRPVAATRDAGTIGVSIGSHTSSRFDLDAVAAAVRGTGLRPVVFQLASTDVAVSESLASRLGGAEIRSFDGNVHSMMEQIAGVSLLLSERLHGAVAAVALGVPCVPLSYASKCDDFWLSVTDEPPRITPNSTSAAIAAEIARAIDTDQIDEFAPRLAQLRSALTNAAASIRGWMSAGQQWPTE